MKVLHVGEYVKGGVATYIKEIIDFQSNSDRVDEVYLMLSKNNSEKQLNIQNNNIIFYDYRRKPKYVLRAILEINKSINHIKPDVIHVHSTFAGLYTRIPFFLKKNRPKIVYCSHGWSFLMDIKQYKKIIFATIEYLLSLKTDLIINISNNEQEKSLQFKLPKNKSRVIYNGINEIEKNDEIDISVDNSKINLLFVGRFDRQKGLDILLKYFSNYNNNKINLYVAGSGVLGNQEIIIPENVINLGWIDNTKIDAYYKMFDAVIIPSRWEGFGLVAIEAMKNKKAVIVSNRGALPELVQDGVNGYVFDLDDMKSLEKVFNTINKEDLVDFGENGYKIFKDKFTSKIMNKQIINTYITLFDNNKKY
ncbi:glycosyltransferase [Metabacillus halosaccharovorans]|uniref:Glycosyltransferase n=1 Tax=Metabacillus halosaccharovorans TaxID=930124 RepID=A0ABT3DBQ5_9BACI|nr:glycosyltransferase [Metabacillus halosaccharovorans]MCV9884490.1 glycosyltransferase [Metabacillus halosaccharovorans]